MKKGTLSHGNRDEWATPWPVYHFIEKLLRVTFTLDPCATKRTTKCAWYYNKKDNGLRCSWKNEIVFCNPPHSDPRPWLSKAAIEGHHGTNSVLLLRADTSTQWFHAYATLVNQVIFLSPRINYIPPPGVVGSTNPFGAVLFAFGPALAIGSYRPRIRFERWK